MPRGGKRKGSGRKSTGERVAVLVRIDRELERRIAALRNGKSMSFTIERLLRAGIGSLERSDEDADHALGFLLGQAAHAAEWKDRNWRNDPATRRALKLALPQIVDLLAADSDEEMPHPFFKSPDEHARTIYFWILNRLRERGDEYEINWPTGHPLRNFPRAAAALNFKSSDTQKDGENS